MKHILPPGEKLQSELDKMPPHSRKELESWIVNSVKINLIKKFEQILEIEGKSNLRKLLLVPVFTPTRRSSDLMYLVIPTYLR